MRTEARCSAFPPVLPDVTLRFGTRLPRDHYIRFETNDYSVNPRFVGRRVEVRVSLDTVVVTCDGTVVAEHRRCLAKHQVLLHPDHARVLRAMRAESMRDQRLRRRRSKNATWRSMTGPSG